MKCGNCDKTDGLCCTSNPPKVKCTVTGNFHEYGDECDAVNTIDITKEPKVSRCTRCIICDSPVELTDEEKLRLERGHYIGRKVCDKCKQATMYVRKQLNI